MDNNLQILDSEEFGYNLPTTTLQDVNEILKLSGNMVNQVSGLVNTVSSTVLQIKEMSATVELEVAKMDHMLDALMVRAQRDAEIYEKSLPVLDNQFAACQNRMDMLMMKAVDLIMTDTSEHALQRQEAMMNLIEVANRSLNSLISKLIPTI